MQNIISLLEPETWKVKTLGDIATEIYSGNGVTKAQLGTGDYPAVKCGDVNSVFPLYFEKCVSFVNERLINKPKFCESGDILIGMLSNKIKSIGKATVYLGKQRCILGNDVVVFRSAQNQKYLAYLLSSDFCRKQIEDIAIAGTVVHLYSKDLKKIKIPVPPRRIQNLIVDYLENWNTNLVNLEDIVQKMIENREKQYSFCSEKLLSRNNSRS